MIETRKQIIDRWIVQGYTDLIRMTNPLPKSDLPWLSGETIHWRSRGYRAKMFYKKKKQIAGYWSVPFNADIDKDWKRCLVTWFLLDQEAREKIK